MKAKIKVVNAHFMQSVVNAYKKHNKEGKVGDIFHIDPYLYVTEKKIWSGNLQHNFSNSPLPIKTEEQVIAEIEKQ